MEQNCFAIWRPSKRLVFAFVESHPLVCNQMRTIWCQRTDIKTHHRIFSRESQHFTVMTARQLVNPADSSRRNSFRGSMSFFIWLRRYCPDACALQVFLIRKRVQKEAVRLPMQGRTQAIVREKSLGS